MKPSVACGIYTRKSSEEGLEQEFNSLEAQREACAAYILSQKAEGWCPLPERYDDGGFSGGTLERPALKRLLDAIANGRVQVVVVYKVDRLTRSLADFAKIVEQFDAQGVSFVSVTQQFNTTSSMGRLTLNVLLSFAQFEREVTGERIRDKIAASKKKGMWMGGTTPIGYRTHERTLVIDDAEAERIRTIYALYRELGCVRRLKTELDQRGWVTPRRLAEDGTYRSGGHPFSRGHLYRILGNPIYRGQIGHKGAVYPGQHPAIVSDEIWIAVQQQLASNLQGTKNRTTAKNVSLLAGFVFDGSGKPLTPTHACKGNRRYRYYVSQALVGKSRADSPDGLRIPATELETAVENALAGFLECPEQFLMRFPGLDAAGIQRLLTQAKAWICILGKHTSPHDHVVLLSRLIEKVIVQTDQLTLKLKPDAFGDAVSDSPIALTVPVRFKRHGLGIRLIVGGGIKKQPAVDHRLVRLLDRGIAWFHQMIANPPKGVAEIAEAEGISGALVSRLTHLAFLAPDLADAIRHGTQPVALTSSVLTALVPLPMDWQQQRQLLGFANP